MFPNASFLSTDLKVSQHQGAWVIRACVAAVGVCRVVCGREGRADSGPEHQCVLLSQLETTWAEV